jgi:hypothetical protein
MSVCVYVCVCECVRACFCVCVCVCKCEKDEERQEHRPQGIRQQSFHYLSMVKPQYHLKIRVTRGTGLAIPYNLSLKPNPQALKSHAKVTSPHEVQIFLPEVNPVTSQCKYIFCTNTSNRSLSGVLGYNTKEIEKYPHQSESNFRNLHQTKNCLHLGMERKELWRD